MASPAQAPDNNPSTLNEQPAAPTPSHNVAVPVNDEFLIHQLLPRREIHLLGGPSGSGKTTLLLEIIEDWRQGRKVFGYQSFPAPFCYVGCDRSKASTARTLERIGISPDNIPIASLIDSSMDEPDFPKVLALARSIVPDCRVLFIDAIGVLCPNGKINDYGVVSRFLTRGTRLCAKEDITIIGLGHSPKVKKGEAFENPRQRFLGSVAWGGFSDTMIFVEPVDPEDPADPNRKVILLPRNIRGETLDYQFNDDGRLVCTTVQQSNFIMDTWLAKQAKGAELSTGALVEAGERAQLNKRTVHRWIKDVMENGRLVKAGHGMYKVAGVS